MTPPLTRRRGWCPTLDEPMQTGDGLLVRVKPPAATLTPAQAHALAEAAATHGNGIIELTQRGNLQIRGLHPETVAPFATAIRTAGLALPPAQERRRPVMPPPLLGADPTIHPGAAALVAALEHACNTDPRLKNLPGKFAIHVDAGGLLGNRPAAASLTAKPDGTLHPGDRSDAPTPAGPLPYDTTQMAYALAPPFAQLDTPMLHALATIATRHATTIRITPWRALILATVSTTANIAQEAGPAWITDPNDPRLNIVACIGAPGCTSATTQTRTDALLLLPLPRHGITHISGCPKGCAHPGPAPLTLVAIDGHYQTIQNGRAQDATPKSPLPLGEGWVRVRPPAPPLTNKSAK